MYRNIKKIKFDIKKDTLQELFFTKTIFNNTTPLSIFSYNAELLNEMFDDGLILLPFRLTNFSQNMRQVDTNIDFSITEYGLKLINREDIIEKINKTLEHFPKNNADQIQYMNSKTLGCCEENEIDALMLYYLIKSFAINKLCVISNSSATFQIKHGLNIIGDEIYDGQVSMMFNFNLIGILSKYTNRQVGLAKELMGHKNRLFYTTWEDVTIHFIEYYLCDRKIVINSKNDAKIDCFLFGNGLSIGLCGKKFFGTQVLMEKFLSIVSEAEYRKILNLVDYMNFFLFEYFTEQEKKYFLNKRCHNEKLRKLELRIDRTNTYLSFFSRFKTKIELKDIGLEDLQMFEIIYRETIEDTKKTINNIDIPIDYSNYFIKTISKIQHQCTIEKYLKEEKFKNVLLYTTNYDNIIEKNLPNKHVIHLHGSVEKNYIITGAEYHNKVGKIINSAPYYFNNRQLFQNEDFHLFSQIKGSLGILGYSGNYNDWHINSLIRQNPNIHTIIYYTNNVELDYVEKRRIVNFFTDDRDNKIIKIVNYNEFYEEYTNH